MDIKKVEALKDNMFNVSLSDGSSFRVHEESLIKYRLVSGRALDDAEIAEISESVIRDEAYIKALKYISYKLRSQYEVEAYLEGDYSKKVIDEAVERLKSEGYINQEHYARAVANTMMNTTDKGPLSLERELRQHRLNDDLIRRSTTEFDEAVDPERMNRIKEKELRRHKGSYRQFTMKLREKLITKGYMIHHIEMIDFDDAFDETRFFEKDFEKYYNKYRQKESGYKLKVKLTQSLMRKGYEYQMIEEKLGGIDDDLF